MKNAAVALALVGLMASPLAAQSRRGRDSAERIPPGHMPPPGMCRVWYEGVPPGRQPRPMSCRDAERVAARDWRARVIYGRDDDRWGRERDRSRDRRSTYPYPDRDGYPYPDRYPQRYPDSRGDYGYNDAAYSNGVKDGFDSGRSDARGKRAFDPDRHGRYRSADRGYDRRYGSKEEYKAAYRDGFLAGYDDGYRESAADDSGRRSGGGAIGGILRRLPLPY